MINRLRLKLVCINMTIVTVMLCVIFGLMIYFTQSNLEHESLGMMERLASEPFRTGRPGSPPNEVRLPYFTLQLDTQGSIKASGSDFFDLSDEEFLMELILKASANGERTGILREYKLRFCRASGLGSEVIVFVDISSEQATITNLIKTCVFIGIISFLAFLALSIVLSHWSVRPVEDAFMQQKQFVADASHELKTPLTVIITNAELLCDPAYSQEEKEHFSRSILTMSGQMRGLVEGMLDLAKIDEDSSTAAFAELDLSRIALQTLLPFEPFFFEKGLSFSSDIAEEIRINGNEAQIKQLIGILLDNAVKYSPEGGFAALSLAAQGNMCLLCVSNSGGTISQEDLDKIFERFYRIDKARSMNQSYGLGLPIARSIVRTHRGKIWAESENGVNRFFVRLPRIS